MNPERLLQNFDCLIDTPDTVPRLRRFILDLAVRGKLVPQDPKDKLAAELLSRVAERLIESPFEIPVKCVSAKAGSLLHIQYGKARPAKDRSHHGIVGYCEEALASH